jgi:hypothetical protein
MSSSLVVRRLLIDMETPLPRRWCGGDAFRTAFFDALSMSFPAGEQFFIDAVRMGLAKLDADQRQRMGPDLQAFIGQEATHRRLHELYNAHLLRMGFVNRWEPRALERQKQLHGKDVRGWLAATAATEHFTAIFAEALLTQPALLDGAEPRLKTLWLWHSAEESEHRSVAFDLYRTLGGNEHWRIRIFHFITWYFAVDLLRQTVNNLWHDGALFDGRTWRSAWRTLFARGGLLRAMVPAWSRYKRADFHPSEGDAGPGERWLQAHADIAPSIAARSSA